MIGFKQINELDLNECFVFLANNQENAWVYEDCKARFLALLEESSFEENYRFLEQHRKFQDNPFYVAVQTLFAHRTEEIRKQERDNYQACEQLEDYRNFVSIYERMLPAYSPVFLDEAREKIQQIQDEQERERKEKEAQRKARRRKIMKKALIVFLALVLVAGVILLYVFGWQSASHCFSSSSSSSIIRFDKGGGVSYLSFYGPSSAFKLYICPQDTNWISYKVPDYCKEIRLTAIPNEGGERRTVLKMTGYPTFWGLPIKFLKFLNETRDFDIIQNSGNATKLEIKEQRLEFSPFGETKRITIKTDGVKLVVKPDSDCEGWVRCAVIQKNNDKDFYHNDIYEITVDTNTKSARTGKVIVETGGKQEKVFINQASGYASKIVLGNDYIKVSSAGDREKLTIMTDGVGRPIIHIDENYNEWIHYEVVRDVVNMNKRGLPHEITYEFVFDENSSDDKRFWYIKFSCEERKERKEKVMVEVCQSKKSYLR